MVEERWEPLLHRGLHTLKTLLGRLYLLNDGATSTEVLPGDIRRWHSSA